MLFNSIIQHRYLLGQLVKRDVLLRYRGAMFGTVWIVLTPLIMLLVYALVFGVIFNTRWPQEKSGVPVWLVLYSGLIAFNIFAETVSRAPTAVRTYPAYVKKILFPVEILPLIPLGASLYHATIGSIIMTGGLMLTGHFEARVLLYPLATIPILLFSMGLGWFLAAWGVFIKDMTQIVPPVIQIAMFLSPVLYPTEAVPENLNAIYHLNPIAPAIEACRNLATGQAVSWTNWLYSLVFCMATAGLGGIFFRHSKEEFADAM